MSVFDQMVEFDIFFKDPKKCFSPLGNSLHDWQKKEPFVIKGIGKKNLRFNRIFLSLLRRKHSVAHDDEERDKELKK